MTPRERLLADIGLIALRHGLTRNDIIGRDRRSKAVAARAAAARHLHKQGRSLNQIGAILGGRHHTTIMNLLNGKRHPLKRNENGQFINDNSADTAAQRLRAIARDLAKQHKPKGERIDTAVRRIGVLADDMDAGIEGAEWGGGNGA